MFRGGEGGGRMWNQWSDVTRKLRDIAVEIAAPQYVEDAEHDAKKREGEGCNLDRECADRWHGEKLKTEHNDDHDGGVRSSQISQTAGIPFRCQSHVAAPAPEVQARTKEANSDWRTGPPVRCSTFSDAAMGPPLHLAVHSTKPRAQHSDEVREAKKGESCGDVGRDDSTVVAANDDGLVHMHQAQVGEPQTQLHLPGSNEQSESRVVEFQEDKKGGHDKVVVYYEQQLEDLRQQIASESAQKEQLEMELMRRTMECTGLKGEVELLQQWAENIVKENETTKEANEELKKVLATLEQEHRESIRQFEILQNAHNALLAKRESVGEEVRRDSAAVVIPATLSDALIGHEFEFSVTKELHQRVEALEEERSALLLEKEQLELLLQEEHRFHRAASEAKEEVLHQSQEQAHKLTQLIEQLETERQQKAIHLSAKEEDIEYEKVESERQLEQGWEEEITRSTLQAEIEALASQLEESKEEAQRVSAILKAEHAHELALCAEQHAQQKQVTMDALHHELKDAQCRVAESEVRRAQLEEEILQLRSRLTDAESNAAALSTKMISTEVLIAELQPAPSVSHHANMEEEKLLIAALTTRKRELEADNARLRELMQQLGHTVMDCLVRRDVKFPPSRDNADLSFLDKVTLLATEFYRMDAELRRAAQLQKEWEFTFEQGRGVNGALQKQIADALTEIASLRENLSMRDQSIAKLKQQLRADAQQQRDTQHLVASLTNELQALKEEKRALRPHVSEPHAGEMEENEYIVALTANVDVLKHALQDRDEELAQAQRSIENMQEVLNTFTLNKGREVEQRTVDMEIEMDQLRTQLLVAQQQRQEQQHEMDALAANCRRDLAAKSLEITSLHRKHAELRKALEETARQLNSGTMIDKRVISHLTVNFIHAFVAQRREADEMLKVLSGLLNWDEAMQEKAGLLPGPANPKQGQQQMRSNIIGGIMSTMWRGPGRATGDVVEKTGDRSSSSGAVPSLAELWVEFLMRESETGGTVAAAAAPSSSSLLSSSSSAAASTAVPVLLPTGDTPVVEDAASGEGGDNKEPIS